jgi:hypothetical protein
MTPRVVRALVQRGDAVVDTTLVVDRAVRLGCGCTRLEAQRPGGGSVHVLNGVCTGHPVEWTDVA